jgi:hypothetical protein
LPQDVPLEVVSKRLGHADIRITAERYLHVYREAMPTQRERSIPSRSRPVSPFDRLRVTRVAVTNL